MNTASHAALVVRHLGQLKQADYRRDAAVVRVQQAESDDGVRSAKLTHDANGNLTRDKTGRQFVYDAWNRLVEVKDAVGATLKRYAYDGLHRRIQETAGGTTTELYYSDAWQVLEERVGGQTRVQYVWSPVYVDALVLRDRDSNGDGTLDERLYVAQDGNYNVTALFDNAGHVVERYVYDPFGSVTVLDADWTERSGGSQHAWVYLHQGGRYDDVSGLYHFRYRDYSPTLGRWLTLDPIRFEAGDVNLYRALGNNLPTYVDPQGTDFWEWMARRIYRSEAQRGYDLDRRLVDYFASRPATGRQIPDRFSVPPKLTGRWEMTLNVGNELNRWNLTHSWILLRGASPENQGQVYTITTCNLICVNDVDKDKTSQPWTSVTRIVNNPILPDFSPSWTCGGYTAYVWAVNTGEYYFFVSLTGPHTFGLTEQVMTPTITFLRSLLDDL